MIKKMVMRWTFKPSGPCYWARMQFVTKVNGEWGIFDVGGLLGYDEHGAEFENLLVKSEISFSTSSGGNVSLPFRWYIDYCSIGSPDVVGKSIEITFKEGIQVLQGFYYYFGKGYPDIIDFYDENDVLIWHKEGLVFEYPPSNQTSDNAIKSTKYFFATPELELMKTYPINKLGTLETNDISHIFNAYSIDQILPEYTEPDGTKIRFALSFDNRNTYKVCNHGSWSEIDKDKIIEDGMTGTELSGLISSNYALALTENKTVDILVGMITENQNSTPNIIKITTDYLEIV